jgi:preprotein translocase subunit SecE
MANKATQFLKEAREELQKVNWPTKQKTINYTLAVIGVSVIVAIFLGTLDYFFEYILKTFILK